MGLRAIDGHRDRSSGGVLEAELGPAGSESSRLPRFQSGDTPCPGGSELYQAGPAVMAKRAFAIVTEDFELGLPISEREEAKRQRTLCPRWRRPKRQNSAGANEGGCGSERRFDPMLSA